MPRLRLAMPAGSGIEWIALLLIVLSCLATGQARAQADAVNYPSRAVRWIIPYPAGASNDVVARLLAQRLSQLWGQPVIVENRSGAGGTIGANLVVRAAPDGYTLLMANPGSNAVTFAIGTDVPYSSADFTHVILLGWAPIMLSTDAKLPWKTVGELLQAARANPGQLTAGSSGTGGSSHLALELFKRISGADIRHVPYKGAAPAVNDVAGGQITMVFTTPASVHALLQSGKLRALLVAGSQRLPGYPDVPSAAESGLAAFDDRIWFGVSAPAGTPDDIVAKINHDLVQIMGSPEIRERLAALGLEPATSTPREFSRIVDDDIHRMRSLIQSGRIQAE